MPPWVSEYWSRFTHWLGVAKDSQRPNWGAFFLLLGISLIAMRWDPVPAPDGAPWWEFYFLNAEGMIASLVDMLKRGENTVGVLLGVFGLKQLIGGGTNGRVAELERQLAELQKAPAGG